MNAMVSRLWNWFDSRMPSVGEQWRIHASEYYAPKNFNFWYFFGSLALLVLVIQIASGIFLTMNYKPDANLAFGSVEYIMRDVPGGWILRYIHSTGASAFFVVVSAPTLDRFCALHVIALPLVLLGLVVAHLHALHDVGSNNPDGVEIKKMKDANGRPLDGIPFHPYYTVKDLMGAVFFLAIFCFVMFFIPEVGGYFLEYNNFIPADPLKTPQHIAPVWYFTPYYSVLRAVPPLFHSQFPGVLAMGAAVLILFFLPWLDRSPVRSIRYRGAYYKSALAVFVVAFLILGYLGTESTTVWGQFGFDAFFLDTKDRATWLARLCTVVYFLFFILMPWYTSRDEVKPVPERVKH